MANDSLLERLAEIEHDQWISWTKAIQRRVTPKERERWRKLWKPYSQLTEEEKDKDRAWAKKVMKTVKSGGTEFSNKAGDFAFQLGRILAKHAADADKLSIRSRRRNRLSSLISPCNPAAGRASSTGGEASGGAGGGTGGAPRVPPS